MTHLYRGAMAAGIQRAEELLLRLEAQGPSSALAGLLLVLSNIHYGASRYTESALAAEQAAEVATAIGDDRTLAQARAQLGACLNSTHQNEAAVGVLEEAVALAERSGDLRAIFAATNNLGISYHLAGRLRSSLACQERAMELSERLGDPAWIAMSLRNAGQTLFELGEWTRARPLLERAVDVGREYPSWCTPYALSSLGMLRAGEGRWEEGRSLAQEAIEQVRASGDIAPLCVALHALARIDLDQDMVPRALGRLAPHVEESAPEHAIVFALLFPVAAEAHLQAGNLARASTLVDTAVGYVSPTDGPDILADLLRIRALIAARSGRWEDARQACDRALELARRGECVRVEAEILLADAQILAGEEKGEQARTRLEQARAIFTRLGAAPAMRRVSQALAAHAGSVAASSAAGTG
jgi:tetratricopeptide (TPR) repeat protein